MLSTEQEYAFDQFKQGKNIFITGPGGSGKSELIRRMSTYSFTQVCAMTGCAAILLECNAKTIHSWAGIGIGDKPMDEIIQSMKKRKLFLKDEIAKLRQQYTNSIDIHP
jgi:ATP-dependent DNA helicase PIF1